MCYFISCAAFVCRHFPMMQCAFWPLLSQPHGGARFVKRANCLASGVARPSRVGEPPTRKTKMRKKMKKNWGKMRKATGKWGKIEEIILSCPPGSERLATALCLAMRRAIKCSQCYRVLCSRRCSSEGKKKQQQKPSTEPNFLTGGEYSVPKTLLGRAANMGSKISLLINQWPLLLCKIWYMNKWIFENFIKIEKKWLKFKKILKKNYIR